MNADIHLEHRAGSSQGKHEGEPSFALCDRLNRTRDNSQRQLPTDHDYAVSTREYQTDQSSLKTAPTAARSVFGKRKRKPPKQPHRSRPVDTATPYQGVSLINLLSVRRGMVQKRTSCYLTRPIVDLNAGEGGQLPDIECQILSGKTGELSRLVYEKTHNAGA
jgi:hypothetical protein